MYPILAVIEALRSERPARPVRSAQDRGSASSASPPAVDNDAADILYVGASQSVEEQLAQRAGLPFEAVETGQLRGRAPWVIARNLRHMARGVSRSQRIMQAFRPDVVLVTGGYVCAPVVVAARRQRRPVLIYLPDVTPGLAIRLLSRLADRVAVTCPEAGRHFPGKALVTGYPVRADLVRAASARGAARRAFGLQPHDRALLVFGGSRGARSINQAVVGCLSELLAVCHVIHITGPGDWPWVAERRSGLLPALQARYHAFAYLHEEMANALAAADLAVSRAGAATLGEYPIVGLPSVLAPYPHAGRHQEANAHYLAQHGAAEVVDDAALGERLLPVVIGLLSDDALLAQMREKALKLATPCAAAQIAQLLHELGAAPGDASVQDRG